jgi:hypothetical protein
VENSTDTMKNKVRPSKYSTIEQVNELFEIHVSRSRKDCSMPQRFMETHLFPKGTEPKPDFVVYSVLEHCMKKTISDKFIIQKAIEYY